MLYSNRVLALHPNPAPAILLAHTQAGWAVLPFHYLTDAFSWAWHRNPEFKFARVFYDAARLWVSNTQAWQLTAGGASVCLHAIDAGVSVFKRCRYTSPTNDADTLLWLQMGVLAHAAWLTVHVHGFTSAACRIGMRTNGERVLVRELQTAIRLLVPVGTPYADTDVNQLLGARTIVEFEQALLLLGIKMVVFAIVSKADCKIRDTLMAIRRANHRNVTRDRINARIEQLEGNFHIRAYLQMGALDHGQQALVDEYNQRQQIEREQREAQREAQAQAQAQIKREQREAQREAQAQAQAKAKADLLATKREHIARVDGAIEAKRMQNQLAKDKQLAARRASINKKQQKKEMKKTKM